jgi:hypothetical protein
MTKIWTPTPTGFRLDTGALELAVTDQSDRGCGWCWHVSVDAMYGHEVLGQGGNMPTAEAAKATATTWARTYCERALAGIADAA